MYTRNTNYKNTHCTRVHSNKKEKWVNFSKDGSYFKIIILITLHGEIVSYIPYIQSNEDVVYE